MEILRLNIGKNKPMQIMAILQFTTIFVEANSLLFRIMASTKPSQNQLGMALATIYANICQYREFCEDINKAIKSQGIYFALKKSFRGLKTAFLERFDKLCIF